MFPLTDQENIKYNNSTMCHIYIYNIFLEKINVETIVTLLVNYAVQLTKMEHFVPTVSHYSDSIP